MYKITKTTFLNIAFLLTLFFVTAHVQLAYADSEKISGIKVIGNTRTEKSTILSYINLKEGDIYSKQKADRSIKTLYNTGFFSKISINF